MPDLLNYAAPSQCNDRQCQLLLSLPQTMPTIAIPLTDNANYCYPSHRQCQLLLSLSQTMSTIAIPLTDDVNYCYPSHRQCQLLLSLSQTMSTIAISLTDNANYCYPSHTIKQTHQSASNPITYMFVHGVTQLSVVVEHKPAALPSLEQQSKFSVTRHTN
jgi:hypothetical protein